MTLNIAELRRLEAEATPGPWETDAVFILDGKKERAGVYTSEEHPSEDDLICELRYADAALIVSMRNALPGLLSQHEQLIERVLRYATDYVPRKDYDKLLKALEAARELADWCEFEVGADLDLTPGLSDIRKHLPPHGGVDA